MIAAWMAYALVIASLVSIAALLAERIALLRRISVRSIWVAALLLSIVSPVLFSGQSARSSEQPAAALAALVTQERPPVYALSPIAWVGGEAAAPAVRVSLDAWLIAGWSVMSICAFVILSIGWLQLRRRLRSAIDGEVRGVSVSITEDVGPAVVGVVRPRIVVPRWLLETDASTQAMAVAHEREHLRAHDIRLLGGALLIAVLFPWNLPIWQQLRRLRFAIEVDCDARVLRAGQSPSAYSAVLLSVATDLAPLRAAAAGLYESRSSLERRIRIMHAPLRRRWRLLAALLASCSVASIVVAANVTAPRAASPLLDGELPLLPSPVSRQTEDEALLARVVGHFHPQLLERLDGRPYVWVIANERGEVSQTSLDVRPSWVSQEAFMRNLRTYLQNAGITEEQSMTSLVMQMPVGPNYAVVSWIVASGSAAQDPGAPAFTPTSSSARATQARVLARAAAERRLIEHFAPDALAPGLPEGEELWFLMDPDGKVLHAGRRATITDPEESRNAMKELFPKLSVGYVTRGTAVKDATGKRVTVSWQWLERS